MVLVRMARLRNWAEKRLRQKSRSCVGKRNTRGARLHPVSHVSAPRKPCAYTPATRAYTKLYPRLPPAGGMLTPSFYMLFLPIFHIQVISSTQGTTTTDAPPQQKYAPLHCDTPLKGKIPDADDDAGDDMRRFRMTHMFTFIISRADQPVN